MSYLEGCLAEHVVLGVAEGLARGHDDRVPGVHAQRVKVLQCTSQAETGTTHGKLISKSVQIERCSESQ